MFGTLRLNQQSNSVDFVQRADGKAFCDAGSIIPPHSACVHCRAKRLRCGGQKPECSRCKSSSLACAYAAVDGTERRRAHGTSQKRNHGGQVVVPPAAASPSSSPFSSSSDVTCGDGNSSSSSISTWPPTSAPSSASSSVSARAPKNAGNDATAADKSTDSSDHHGACSDADPFDVTIGSQCASLDLSYFTNTAAASGENATTDNIDLRAATSRADSRIFASLLAPYDDPALFPTELATGADSGTRRDCRCLHTITPLLEEVEERMHTMRPPRLEGILAWQKNACVKCAQVLGCPACYASSEHMMLLIMFSDKLVILTQKLIQLTAVESSFQGTILPVRDYEICDPAEVVGLVRLLGGMCIKHVAKLLVCIKSSG
ncbi:hypothetical protein F4808DRAFT_464121 [Astrocystis sublimbata]|nr:hypothetical protein F4808DRAFT_464121 [Astrocystis sublimbata]